MGKGPKSHHVVPNPNGGWDVKRGGAGRASMHADTKREAIDRICEFSSDSHGNDPNPSKG